MPDEKDSDFWFKEFRDSEKALWTKIGKMEETLYGNGQEGMRSSMLLIKNDVENILKDLKNDRDEVRRKERTRSTREWSIVMVVLGLIAEQIFFYFFLK